MTSIIKADVFFFITSISVVVVGILLTVALVYAIRTLQDIRKFSRRLLKEGDEILTDITEAREYIKKKGGQIATATGVIRRFVSRGRKKKAKVTTSSPTEDTIE